jgi:hypothetical protein
MESLYTYTGTHDYTNASVGCLKDAPTKCNAIYGFEFNVFKSHAAGMLLYWWSFRNLEQIFSTKSNDQYLEE